MWDTNGGPIVYVNIGIAKGYAEIVSFRTNRPGYVWIRFIGASAQWHVHSDNYS